MKIEIVEMHTKLSLLVLKGRRKVLKLMHTLSLEIVNVDSDHPYRIHVLDLYMYSPKSESRIHLHAPSCHWYILNAVPLHCCSVNKP